MLAVERIVGVTAGIEGVEGGAVVIVAYLLFKRFVFVPFVAFCVKDKGAQENPTR